MSEEKEKKREKLADVAKKYNIAIERIVELLKKRGFEVDGRNPNARLTGDMVEVVQKEFASDKKKREQAEERAAQIRSNTGITNRNQSAANRDNSRNLTTTTVVEEVIETAAPTITVTTRLATENETVLTTNTNAPIPPEPVVEKENKLSRLSAIANKLKASKQVEHTNKTTQQLNQIKEIKPAPVQNTNPLPLAPDEVITSTPAVAESIVTSENDLIPAITNTVASEPVALPVAEPPAVIISPAELKTEVEPAIISVPAPVSTAPPDELIPTITDTTEPVLAVSEPTLTDPIIESKTEIAEVLNVLPDEKQLSTPILSAVADVDANLEVKLGLDSDTEKTYPAAAPSAEEDLIEQIYDRIDPVSEIPVSPLTSEINSPVAIEPIVEISSAIEVDFNLNPEAAAVILTEPAEAVRIPTAAGVEVADSVLQTDAEEGDFTDADLDDYLSRFEDRVNDDEDEFVEEQLIFEGPEEPNAPAITPPEDDKTAKTAQVIRASDHAPKLQGLTVTGFIDPSLLRSGRNRKEKDKDKDKELASAAHANVSTAGNTNTESEAEKAKRNKRKRKRKPATTGNINTISANQTQQPPNNTNNTNSRQNNTGGNNNNNNNRNQNQSRHNNNNNSGNRPQNRQLSNNIAHNNNTNTVSSNTNNNNRSSSNQHQRPTNTFVTGNINRRSPQSKKFRRARIEEQRAKRSNQAASINENVNVLEVTEYLTANELATLMDVPVQQVISKCMELGLFVSINQRINSDVIQLIAEEFNFEVHFVTAEEQAEIAEEDEDEELLEPRPPIVTVMGHVDHGKTSLLDHIRQSNVIAGEAGGITQHIGAYSVELPDGRKITFLDTPGHEAFTAMRARGAQVTDIVIIVIAADDQVMPQTREAINHAQAAGVPMVFAINKIDKPGANPEKIKEQLSMMNLLVEDWGGNYQCQEISAKLGKGVDELLEKVLLEAELLDLKANPNKPARGTVIESQLDRGRGIVTTILVQSGTLNVGDVVLCNAYYGKVKAILDERQHRIKKAGPSMPVQILGLNGVPQAGDKFQVMEQEREAREIATKRQQQAEAMREKFHKVPGLNDLSARIQQGNLSQLNVIVKGDVDGSVEALSDSLIKLSNDEVSVHIVLKAVGQITESDINLASVSNAFIIGFQVRPSPSARKLAEAMSIEIRLYSVIYDAINDVKAALEGLLQPKIEETIVGVAEVREIFKITKVGTVAGCMVTEGKINRNTPVRLIRDGVVVYSGNILNLRRFKDDVREVAEGFECGISIENYNDIKVGDLIEAYTEIEIKRTLS